MHTYFEYVTELAQKRLMQLGFTGNCQEVIEGVLRNGRVQPPPDFPGSCGCVRFADMIVKYILKTKGRPNDGNEG